MTSSNNNHEDNHIKKSYSLQFKIMALATGLILAQGVMSFFQERHATAELHIKQESTLLSARSSFSSILSALLYERYGDVQAFAVNPILYSKDIKGIETAFDTYVNLYQIYQGIIFVANDGSIIATNTKGPDGKALNVSALKGKNFASETWFQAAMQERYTDDKDKGILGSYVGPVGLDPISEALTGLQEYGLHFATKVKDVQGKALGVLTTRSNLSWLDKDAAKISTTLRNLGIKSIMLNVIDEKGTLIFDFDPEQLADNKKDYSVLGKMNTLSLNSDGIKKAMAGEEGLQLDVQPRERIQVVSSFGPVKDVKFPSILGWTVLAQAEEGDIYGPEKESWKKFFTNLFLVVVASLVLGYFVSRMISNRFIKVANKLKESSEKTAHIATELTASSKAASTAISAQGAAVQETVASMAEMASMIAQTSQNTKASMTLTQKATEKTEEGNQIMQRLVGSMDSIQQANAQLQNIGTVISEIATKTAVINDIVFKTQLLSFNASIEAARAGQHGRGFAVVAAEVGNLAQMSGNAAKEIQSLLDDSRAQVQSILESTQERVSEGQTVSADALATFGEIAKTIEGISEQIRNINEATQEQDIGVKQTSTAMVQLDEYAQRNNIVAQQVSNSAHEIEREADRLFRIMQASRVLILGSNTLKKNKKSRDLVDSLISEDENDEYKPPSRRNNDSRNHNSHSDSSNHGNHNNFGNQNNANSNSHSGNNQNRSNNDSNEGSLLDKLSAKMKHKEPENSNESKHVSPPIDSPSPAQINADDDTFRAA